MRTTPEFRAWLDEHFPESKPVRLGKNAIRKAAGVLHEDVPSVQAWIDVMRDRARDLGDPED